MIQPNGRFNPQSPSCQTQSKAQLMISTRSERASPPVYGNLAKPISDYFPIRRDADGKTSAH